MSSTAMKRTLSFESAAQSEVAKARRARAIRNLMGTYSNPRRGIRSRGFFGGIEETRIRPDRGWGRLVLDSVKIRAAAKVERFARNRRRGHEAIGELVFGEHLELPTGGDHTDLAFFVANID